MAETTTVSWVVTIEQKARLERLAVERVCSVSYLARQAIDQYLSVEEQRRAELAAHSALFFAPTA